ncbi:MAG: HipA domain-containing protein [Rikenellaceae bacterium]
MEITLSNIAHQFAQTVMILTLPNGDTSTVELDTIRTILEDQQSQYKPNGSYEQVAQIIEENSMISKLDILNFWEQVAFGWVVGCTQMGYDSFALHSPHKGLYALAPAYDLSVTAITNPQSADSLPLTVNRKSRSVTRTDFETAMKQSGLRAKIVNGIFTRFIDALDKWCDIIDSSQLDEETKTQYKEFLRGRVAGL